MAKQNGKKTAKAVAPKKATTPKKEVVVKVKHTAEELVEIRKASLAKLEEQEKIHAEKIAARKAKLEALANKSGIKAEKKAKKDAEKKAKKESREIKKLEKAEAKATRLLAIDAEKQRKLQEKLAAGKPVSNRGAGFRSGPDGKDSIGEFILKTVQDTPFTVEALQDALIAYYGGGEKSEQWKRTVATYVNTMKSAYPMKLKLAKRGLFSVYDKDAKTVMVRDIKPKEQGEIFGGLQAFKLAKETARAAKLAEAKATIERLAALRAEAVTETPSPAENQ